MMIPDPRARPEASRRQEHGQEDRSHLSNSTGPGPRGRSSGLAGNRSGCRAALDQGGSDPLCADDGQAAQGGRRGS